MDNKKECRDKNSSKTKEEIYHSVVQTTIPLILEKLLAKGLIDINRIDDHKYLNKIIRQSIEAPELAVEKGNQEYIVEGIELTVTFHQDFIEIAEYAIENGKLCVAVILLATTIEHILNIYLRIILSNRGLPSEEITRTIRRSNFHSKIEEFISISDKSSFPENVQEQVKQLIRIRNAIVHYKAVPLEIGNNGENKGSEGYIEEEIEKLNFDKLLKLPNQLENIFQTILHKMNPKYELIEKMCDVFFRSSQ